MTFKDPGSRSKTSEQITAAGQIDRPKVTTMPPVADVPPDSKDIGKILLQGVVSSVEDKEGIEQAVRSCVGVSDVENQIRVSAEKIA